MRPAGRVWNFASFCACIAITASRDYGVPIEIKVWDTGRSPLAHMVDVTNGFGLRVLAEHNFLNDNNIAFSPYGLMGIMVALFEGVDGESSYEIQRGMQLPWNRNVMRVGFRDIHRTLKTYFVPEEGFLAGLALNNENVTFNDGYKKILRFYGFDLENDQLPTLPPTNATSNGTSEATTVPPPASETSTIAAPVVSSETVTQSTKEETTLNPNAETIDIESRSPTEATSPIPSLAPNSETTTDTSMLPTNEATTLTEVPTTAETSPVQTSTMPPPEATTTPPAPTTTAAPTSEAVTTTMMPPPESSAMTTMSDTSSSDSETIGQQTSLATAALTLDSSSGSSSTVDMGSLTTESATPTTTTTSKQMTDGTLIVIGTSTPQDTTEAPSTTGTEIILNEASLETLQRRKKSIVDFIFTNPPYIDDYFFYRSSYYVGPENTMPGSDDKMFLANGLKNVQVTYMRYDTVLEHAYLPHLEAAALRLPLDSERYYLLVVLPERADAGALPRLLARMARESDLADVYAALRPRRVRAIVPSFMVKGHVTLTTDLQKLGIRNVFEPRQRDFLLMTNQMGVYVRSIEQAVSVAIRKYKPDDHKKNRYVTNRDPVKFSATYPFLYFVMDASIHVALMAGKMVDPLNSRIL